MLVDGKDFQKSKVMTTYFKGLNYEKLKRKLVNYGFSISKNDDGFDVFVHKSGLYSKDQMWDCSTGCKEMKVGSTKKKSDYIEALKMEQKRLVEHVQGLEREVRRRKSVERELEKEIRSLRDQVMKFIDTPKKAAILKTLSKKL